MHEVFVRRSVLLVVLAALFLPSLLLAQSVSITPGYLSVATGQRVQYMAAVSGLANKAVTWQVSDIAGGSAKTGTITGTGLYTAPSTVPSGSVTITALASDGVTSGTVYVNVAPVGPTILAATPVPAYIGSYSMTFTGTSFKQGAVVVANGVVLSTTFVNATKLTAIGWQGSAADVAFQVQNPGTLVGPAFTVSFKSKTPQTISPVATVVSLRGTQQFISAGATSWKASAGSISASGLYTAPATMPVPNVVTVTATGPNGSASALVTLLPGLTITPATISMKLGKVQQFVSLGATSWKASVGTITALGLYTAPATMPASSTVTITATGVLGSATATVTLLAPPTISPTSASMVLGTTQQFIATGATSFSATAGTITSTGLFTAPAVMPPTKTLSVIATGPGGQAYASVTLVGTQIVSPTTATVVLGKTQQFTSPGATSFTATAGTITSTGLFTAPSVMPATKSLTVTAVGPGGTAYAAVTLVGTQVISPVTASVGLGKTQQFTSAGATSFTASAGTITSTGLFTAPSVMPATKTVSIVATGTGGTAYASVTLVAAATHVISPLTASVMLGKTQQFTSAGATSWTATAGTITASGLYTAPATMPASNSVTVTAKGPLGAASAVVTLVGTQTISPATVSVALGKTQQFTSAGSTSWTATAGTITSAGLYTAPATMPASSSVTVTATGPGGSASAAVTLLGVQTISPATASVTLGKTQQFTSAGATSWTATAGTITSAGLYTAPATMPPSAKVTITATGPSGSASAAVTLVAAAQTISPVSASMYLGGTQQFTSAGATSWTATAGTVTSAGLFTAPTTMPASGSVTVTATGPGGSASASVSLLATQTITPATVSLTTGGIQQFTSAGATSWKATAGTITSAGLFTAPATAATVTVTATGPGGSATATVTVSTPSAAVVIKTVGSGTLPLGVFTATITGTGFTAKSVAYLNGSPLITTYKSPSLSVTGYSGTAGTASITVTDGANTSAAFLVPVGVVNPKASASAARRFLEQGAFGPTPTDAAHVQTIGEAAWITEQLAMPQVSNYNSITSDQNGLPQHFLTDAVMNQDQLRQRVAFALSQIFVTSLDKLIFNPNMISYQNMLLADAFVNYRQIMMDVTLSPAMGQYLDMANNAVADPSIGSAANENYARELMQLFTIGTNKLNQDGSLQLDANGLPIPNYIQANIAEFARVYTGWTYAPAPGQPVEWGVFVTSNGPMAAYSADHDFGAKTLLGGVVSPAGVTPLQDLNNALDNIFSQPSIAPFVGKMLIQHLVKSNPSAAYIGRVSAAFNNNGSGVRGDMKAVITAVLMDPEARANDEGGKDLPTDGHLQEPALFIAGMVRAFGGQMTDDNYYQQEMAALGQDLYDSPSVFNYYSPGYVATGSGGLTAPEFQIHTPNNAIVRANEVSNLLFSEYQNPVLQIGPGTTVDITAYVPLAANPSTLVDALDLTLTHGTMPAAMKSKIIAAIAADDQGPIHQVETGCYLILTSSYYNVWH